MLSGSSFECFPIPLTRDQVKKPTYQQMVLVFFLLLKQVISETENLNFSRIFHNISLLCKHKVKIIDNNYDAT